MKDSNVPLYVRVPADVKAAAQAYADQRGLTLAAAVNILLRCALDGNRDAIQRP